MAILSGWMTLELMIEFADLSQPQMEQGSRCRKNSASALNEVTKNAVRRQAQIRWKGNGYSHEIKPTKLKSNTF